MTHIHKTSVYGENGELYPTDKHECVVFQWFRGQPRIILDLAIKPVSFCVCQYTFVHFVGERWFILTVRFISISKRKRVCEIYDIRLASSVQVDEKGFFFFVVDTDIGFYFLLTIHRAIYWFDCGKLFPFVIFENIRVPKINADKHPSREYISRCKKFLSYWLTIHFISFAVMYNVKIYDESDLSLCKLRFINDTHFVYIRIITNYFSHNFFYPSFKLFSLYRTLFRFENMAYFVQIRCINTNCQGIFNEKNLFS